LVGLEVKGEFTVGIRQLELVGRAGCGGFKKEGTPRPDGFGKGEIPQKAGKAQENEER
jgi:hypothetical protein